MGLGGAGFLCLCVCVKCYLILGSHSSSPPPHPPPAPALDQWERELQLFNALKQLQLYKLYKVWKNFRVWKKAVNHNKLSTARGSLGRHLFLLSPVFQDPMRSFNKLCYDLSGMRLHDITGGQVRCGVLRGPCDGSKADGGLIQLVQQLPPATPQTECRAGPHPLAS